MASFTFLHAADLHLGSPLQGLSVKDPEIAARFAEAIRRAFQNLVAQAIERKVAFLVIAGDIYDGEWPDNNVGLFFNREVARLDRAGIPVFLLKGNHDADSVVTKSIALPGSVRAFDTAKPESFRIDHLKVALHGQGFRERAERNNLALAYPPPVPGQFNIGVLHTALTGRPPHASYAPCSAEELAARGYDYWALGHVHDFEIVAEDPPIVFPGNLQARSIRETGEKGAVLVTVEDGQVTNKERLLVDEARFAEIALDIGGIETMAQLLTAVEERISTHAETAKDRLLALRLRLTGTSPLRRRLIADRANLVDDVQAACHRCHPDIWLEKLDLRVSESATPAQTVNPDQKLDIEPLLQALVRDPEILDQAQGIVAEIAAKLPGGLGAEAAPLGADMPALLAEAADLLRVRLATEEDADAL
ncbi:metallophosphoesterase family protein [Afifella marina]|uniref:DNA repair exonuclease SbcCD nuclease subunit n=1 Tax=Afifella marina DSM 2698 TaxID=1120955 RepID=A0A1G5NND5_AFIMA|nr:DNA repair exonuclease [Afifella marina]MBK1624593.1 DNA repair exonuclease [Afifella marina DSM 2698]MBK1627486.1 DNA repair exonuclease [Afifella marina]MBK5918544.1 DNA repair exonuclease [Afifella marina]RAI18554.1 DNA repair exonuclease [Afifella marina DSM 2698]SCZ38897.1 DNA repair exonuclease SbcCD nuclease subunit [Afifella marina DSM 2698]